HPSDREVIRRLNAFSSMGLSPPAGISRSCPHYVIPVPPGAVAGQKYHCARTFHRLAGSCPAYMNGIFLARPSGVIAYGSTGWHFHTRTGKYLMNDIQFSKIHITIRGGSLLLWLQF
ncbi:MAG: hypothetical protein VZR00_08275, partial [Lachnospiraceae bacterium]|nr:hypothetical protein [Lachnospiraceae bacterium]